MFVCVAWRVHMWEITREDSACSVRCRYIQRVCLPLYISHMNVSCHTNPPFEYVGIARNTPSHHGLCLTYQHVMPHKQPPWMCWHCTIHAKWCMTRCVFFSFFCNHDMKLFSNMCLFIYKRSVHIYTVMTVSVCCIPTDSYRTTYGHV